MRKISQTAQKRMDTLRRQRDEALELMKLFRRACFEAEIIIAYDLMDKVNESCNLERRVGRRVG